MSRRLEGLERLKRLMRQVVGIAALVTPGVPAAAGQTASEPPRTTDGRPDLQGVWDFRTITPLERPEELSEREFLSDEEAATLEQQAIDRNNQLNQPSEVRSEPLPAGGDVGAYNNFWMDRGTRVADGRTSLIVDPPNGSNSRAHGRRSSQKRCDSGAPSTPGHRAGRPQHG